MNDCKKITLGALIGGGIGFFKTVASSSVADVFGLGFFVLNLGVHLLIWGGIGVAVAMTEIYLEDTIRSYGFIP